MGLQLKKTRLEFSYCDVEERTRRDFDINVRRHIGNVGLGVLTQYRLVTDGSIAYPYTTLASRRMVMESRLNTKHKENKRLRPTYGATISLRERC